MRRIFSFCLAGMLGATPLAAQEWSAQVTPYVWATGLGGNITPFSRAPTLSFDKSFSSVLEDLDSAFFVTGFARRDRFVVLGDLSWSASSKDGHVSPTVSATAKLTQLSMTVAGGYRAVDRDDVSVDTLVGLRAWRIKSSVAVAGGAYSLSPSDQFVDPILVMRANFRFAENWSSLFYADYGGFGVGSDRTYQVMATVNYQVTDAVFLSAGYRALHVDYSNGGTKVNAVMAGPLLGVTWTF